MTTTVLDYLRHGEPQGGSGVYRGHSVDDPLSDKGWAQMQATTDEVQGWTRIVTSPLSRCAEFARHLGEQRNLPVDVVDPLKEVGFGSWEGKSRAELLQHRADEYHAFYADPVNNRPEGAESLDAFGQRAANVFQDLVSQYPGERLLVIAHAGVIRATLGHVTQAPAINWYRAKVDNAAISRFQHTEKGAQLVAHNWRPVLL